MLDLPANVVGIKLLGALLGSKLLETLILGRQVGGIKRLLEAFPTLYNPHIEFVLLHSCFSFPKYVLSLRTTDTSILNKLRWDSDSPVHEALGMIVGAPIHDPNGSRPPSQSPKGGFSQRSTDPRPMGQTPT